MRFSSSQKFFFLFNLVSDCNNIYDQSKLFYASCLGCFHFLIVSEKQKEA